MKYIYLLRAGENHYKVGVATSVKKRVGNIQTSNPVPIHIVLTKLVNDAYTLEGRIHTKLAELKVENGGTEWFKLTPDDVVELCIEINKEPEVDFGQAVRLRDILAQHADNQKRIEKKLSRVVDLALQRQEQLNKHTERLIEPKEPKPEKPKKPVVDDEVLLQVATELVRRESKASTSLLQRRMQIGYGRAARLIEKMEEQGIVGPENGSRPREVFQDQWLNSMSQNVTE